MPRYVVFDTETPNTFNNRMCQIGVTVVEDGEITGGFTLPHRPECDYSWFNIQIHGITPEATNASPCFAGSAPASRREVFGGDLCLWRTTLPSTWACWPAACVTTK